MKRISIFSLLCLLLVPSLLLGGKDRVEELFFEADDYYYAGLKDRAEELFKKIISINPDHLGALKRLAEIYAQEGRYKEALQYIDRIISLRDDLPGALDLAGVIYKNLGDSKKAGIYFQKACQMGVKASCADLKADDGSTSAKASKSQVKNPYKEGTADYYYHQGKLYQAQGRYDEALIAFEQAISIDPGHAKAIEDAGYEWAMKGDVEKAINYYKRGLAINQKNGALWDKLGLAYNSLGNLEEAKKAFEQACKMGIWASCNDAQALGSNVSSASICSPPDISEAQELIEKGEFNKAEEILRGLIEKSPDHYLVHYAYAEYYYAIKEFEFAIMHLNRSLEVFPTYYKSWLLMSRIYADMKKTKESKEALKKACKLGFRSDACPK